MSHIGAIDCQREGTLATVTLRRAVKMNAMTRAMWRDLRCVLVQGEGADSPMAGRRNKQNLRWPPLASLRRAIHDFLDLRNSGVA